MGGADDFPELEALPNSLLEPEDIEPLDDAEAAQRGLS